MKVYISGPMSFRPDHNFEALDAAAAYLRSLGAEVVNPADLDRNERREGWENCLRRDIQYLVGCDAVAVLPEYETSRGARLETHVAHELRMPILPAFSANWHSLISNHNGG